MLMQEKEDFGCPVCQKEKEITTRFILAAKKVRIECPDCGFAMEKPIYNSNEILDDAKTLRALWKRVWDAAKPKIEEIRIFDKEETYTNCTVQVLENSVTGDTSVGWWENDEGSDE
ncbi:MAG: hypothetical protein IIZ35_04070 [Clostridia bacterium]|nr:hypothetical protein [Clostridia bacterium]